MEFPMLPMGRSSVLEEVGESLVPAPVPMAPTGAGMLTLLQIPLAGGRRESTDPPPKAATSKVLAAEEGRSNPN